MSAYNSLEPAALALYSELLEGSLAAEVGHSGSPPPGSLVTKEIRGQRYWYLQLTELGARRQVYLGPDRPELRTRLAAIEEGWRSRAEQARSGARLVAMLLASGVRAIDAPSGRVLDVLSRHHVFAAGAVLVGSHAFSTLGTALGVRWESAYETHDIDLASTPTLAVAVRDADLPAALAATPFVFQAIPGFNPRHPSTSFSVRGRSLRLDVLTPLVGPARDEPTTLPQLAVAAQPLRFLDYLIDDPIPAMVIHAEGVRVSVPSPARFALHELLVSEERPPHQAAKQRKDLAQAEALLAVLLDARPGDVTLAWDELAARGPGWRKRVRAGLRGIDASLAKRARAAFGA